MFCVMLYMYCIMKWTDTPNVNFQVLVIQRKIFLTSCSFLLHLLADCDLLPEYMQLVPYKQKNKTLSICIEKGLSPMVYMLKRFKNYYYTAT